MKKESNFIISFIDIIYIILKFIYYNNNYNIYIKKKIIMKNN